MNPLRSLLAICIASVLVPVVPFLMVGELPGDQWLQATSDDALWFGFTGAALLMSDVLLPIPSSILGSLLGARLGAAAGVAWTLSGLMMGNLIGYGLGRLGLGHTQARIPAAPAASMVVLTRAVPVFSEAATLAAGATGMPFGSFVLAALAGNALYAVLLAGAGAAWLPAGWLGPGLFVPLALPPLLWFGWRSYFRPRPRPTMGRQEP